MDQAPARSRPTSFSNRGMASVPIRPVTRHTACTISPKLSASIGSTSNETHSHDGDERVVPAPSRLEIRDESSVCSHQDSSLIEGRNVIRTIRQGSEIDRSYSDGA